MNGRETYDFSLLMLSSSRCCRSSPACGEWKTRVVMGGPAIGSVIILGSAPDWLHEEERPSRSIFAVISFFVPGFLPALSFPLFSLPTCPPLPSIPLELFRFSLYPLQLYSVKAFWCVVKGVLILSEKRMTSARHLPSLFLDVCVAKNSKHRKASPTEAVIAADPSEP
ncbi:hypothetical protein MUK42_19578 [Musa troglodytarum]|uniref:Uncharacterized protein n=1 Tax=Musa troglodytarum TaxID=320322 RepID=A0A9E7ET70_9LILI|nr:hypothetical protein MUK42_03222 [Musa troglodytarum]URD83599.1 hypothetical protein MUK42_19578 [Musa troglodytarum]